MRLLIVFAFIVLLASCAPKEKLITGTWKLKDIELESESDSANLAFINMAAKQMKANVSFTMKPDSTYTIMQLQDRSAKHGKWWFSADKKTLYTKTDMGLSIFKVIKLTKNELIYESNDEHSGQRIKVKCGLVSTEGSK